MLSLDVSLCMLGDFTKADENYLMLDRTASLNG